MANEDEFSEVLIEFARTLTTDFPIQGILDHLVHRIVDVLPITAAGVTLITQEQTPRYIAASNADALRFERLQSKAREGPCLLACNTGAAVQSPDLCREQRFPHFAREAVAAGLAAVFTFPLRHDDECLGALDLYRDEPGAFDERALVMAQTLADVTSSYLLNAQARDLAKATAARFQRSSLHDPLTGLPNRLLFEERLEHAAERAHRSRTNAAVLFADLDRFKSINDTFGHQAGDKVLIAVAQRLSAVLRSGDTLARFSGDEFVLLCEDLVEVRDVELLADRIREAFSRPFVIDGYEARVSASIGIAFAGPGDAISSRLVDHADAAMYQTKRRGGDGHQLVDTSIANQHNEDIAFESDLRRALSRDELEVAYQPIVRSSDGVLTGVEALLRWNHPTRGNISPLLIIAAAERSGLISEIGAWVLERACDDHRRWRIEYPDHPLMLAVNVSARQLLSTPGFEAVVAGVLVRTGMDPTKLVLEMTESVLIDNNHVVAKLFSDLASMGIRFALDDFGTGYSSLTYLGRLPIEIVKIDRTFIAGIGQDATGRPIVAAITSLAHTLGLVVVAEGVETANQRDVLNLIGCDFSQGFFYAMPMSAGAIGMHVGLQELTPLHLSADDLVLSPGAGGPIGEFEEGRTG